MIRGSAGTRPRAGRLGGHLVNARHVLHPFVVVAGLVLAATIAAPQASAAPAIRGSVDITSLPQTSSGTTSSLTLSGKATSPTGQVHLIVDGAETGFPAAVGSRGAWSAIVSGLLLGAHEICAEVRSDAGDRLAVDCVTYTVAPDVTRFDVDWPLDGGGVLTLFQVQGSCQDGTEVVISLDGGDRRTAACSGGRYWTQYLTTAGPHTVSAVLTYQGQVLTTVERSFTAEAPPAVDVEITTPADATTVSTSSVGIEGTTNQPETRVTLTVNDGEPRETWIDQDGTWSGYAPLSYGDNLVCVTTSDLYGTSDRDCITVTFAIGADTLVLTRPVNGGLSGTFVYYEGSCHTGTQLRIEIDGVLHQEDTCYYDYFGGSIPYVADGEHTLTVTMLWEGIEISTETATVTVDTLAPAPPTVLTPTPGATIRSAPLTLSGTAESGATVELMSTIGETVLAAPVAADGTWSMTIDRAYLESLGVVTGQRETLRLRLEAVDSVGNRSYTQVVTYTVRMR